jgi:uncharacterized protein (DUF302 family)
MWGIERASKYNALAVLFRAMCMPVLTIVIATADEAQVSLRVEDEHGQLLPCRIHVENDAGSRSLPSEHRRGVITFVVLAKPV